MTSSPQLPVFEPHSPYQIGLEKLLHAGFYDVDLTPLGAQILAHLADYPDDAGAYMDLSFIMQIRGDEAMARSIQLEALKIRRLYHLRTNRTDPPALRLLAIMAPGNFMANTPLEFLVSGSDIALDLLYLAPGEAVPDADELPPHDVVFVAVGESEFNNDILWSLNEAVGRWTKPLLNHPLHSLTLARDTVASLLDGEPRIYMAPTARVQPDELESIAAGRAVEEFLGAAGWPLIVRPLDSHAGHGLEKIDNPAQAGDYLARHAEVEEFFIAEFVDYRSMDGLYRKYRIVFVQGKPFLCHMAISTHWMIHYLNASMTENADRRAEEEHVMENFDSDFAQRHAQAFADLCGIFQLDYFGIDCGETSDGRLLIFEVDTGMIVHAMDPVDMFPYKPKIMRKAFDAFQDMIKSTAADVHA